MENHGEEHHNDAKEEAYKCDGPPDRQHKEDRLNPWAHHEASHWSRARCVDVASSGEPVSWALRAARIGLPQMFKNASFAVTT